MVFQGDLQLLESRALELKRVIEEACGRLKLFKELGRRMCDFLEASNVLDDVFQRMCQWC